VRKEASPSTELRAGAESAMTGDSAGAVLGAAAGEAGAVAGVSGAAGVLRKGLRMRNADFPERARFLNRTVSPKANPVRMVVISRKAALQRARGQAAKGAAGAETGEVTAAARRGVRGSAVEGGPGTSVAEAEVVAGGRALRRAQDKAAVGAGHRAAATGGRVHGSSVPGAR